MHDLNKQADIASTTDKDERARAAVKAFRGMQAALSAYARAITQNPKVRVEVASGPPRTDGTIIYYRPPIALGDPQRHDRFVCSKRDDDGLQVCPACKVREEVLVNIYHEIAHQVFETFAETTDEAKRDALDAAIKEWGGEYEEKLRKKILESGWERTRSYMGLAGVVSPYLPHLFNAMEDARVDSSMFEVRKGTRKMLAADTLNLLRKGIPTDTPGELKLWREMDLNSQVSLACYLETVGYAGWKNYMHEKVVETITDPQLQELYAKLRKARSAADVYNLTFPMLARLRELGYMLAPEERPEPEEQEDDGPADADDSGDAEDSGDSGADEGFDESDGSRDGSEDSQENSSSQDSPEDSEASDDRSSAENDSESGGQGAGETSDSVSGDTGGDSETASGTVGDKGTDVPESSEHHESDSDVPSGDSNDQGDGRSETSDPGDNSGGTQSPSDGDEGSPDESLEDLSDADSNGVSEESDGPGPDGGSDEVSDGEGGGESGQSESADQGTNGESDSDGSSATGGGAESEGESDEPDSGDDSDANSHGGDSSEGSSDGELDHSQPGGSEGSGTQPIPHSDITQEQVESGETDADDGAGESSGPEHEADRPDLGELTKEGDQGLGGVRVNEVGEEQLPDYGTPEDVATSLAQIHPDLKPGDEVDMHGTPEEKEAIESAVIMGTYFEWPSTGVKTIEEYHYGPNQLGWITESRLRNYPEDDLRELGIICDVDIPESVLGQVLLKTRKIFDDNKRAAYQRNLRSGRVNAKVLGRRAWKGDDDRLFGKRRLPGKKDYAVKIMIDISTSNLGPNLSLVKRAAYAQAELLHRAGIQFSITAHSAAGNGLGSREYTMHLHHIKDWDQPWDKKSQAAVAELSAVGGNLDGHAMEYARKELGKVQATDKILLYYTDGKFPAANKEEELEVLLHQLKLCKRDQITLLGVGVRTDSPRRHGLDTVQVDSDDDLQRVVEHLGKRLQWSAR